MRTIPLLIVLLVLLLIGGRCDIDHAVRRDRQPSQSAAPLHATSDESAPS